MLYLSKELFGHEQDVKALATHGNSIFSASRDSTVRQWTLSASSNASVNEYRVHQGFVNSITYATDYVVSGGQDAIINLVKPGSSNPEYTLIGHGSNVCALHADASSVVSGSWDGTAKLWRQGQCIETMEGHQGAVWAVLLTEHGVLTGGADKTIRMWKNGRQVKNYPAGKDCVRALALHPLGFVSAGNDAIIRIHTFDGEILQQLQGHDSFIYSLATTDDGTIYSAAEDKTLRVWQDGSLIQTIAHPAVSVWSVALLDNGDVITGASDAVVRVFTAANERKATADELKRFEESVATAAAPAQASNIPNNLPGLEALAGPGKKEGEVKMIRTSPDLVEAHQWSGGVWTKIGEVVGASAKKVEYEGKQWDFVFDVDIAEGQPPLKLPYNTEENPYEAANRFIAKYELDVGFQAQIVKFIETNTGGVPLGVPKDVPKTVDAQSTTNLLPQTSMLTMRAGNPAPIKKKFLDFANSIGGMDSAQIDALDVSVPSAAQIELLVHSITNWPRDKRFPGLDLLRLSIPDSRKDVNLEKCLEAVLQASELQNAATSDKTQETNRMLGLRFVANCYSLPHAAAMLQERSEMLIETTSAIDASTNRNLSLALSTCLLNISVFAKKNQSAIDAINLIEPLIRLMRNADGEVQYRALIALGTLLHISGDVVEAARDVFDAPSALGALQSQSEDKVKAAVKEIQGLLRG